MTSAHASEYRDQVVEISRLTVNSNILEDITFVNCQIVGPAVILPLEDVSIVESGWDAPGFDSIAWVIPEGRSHIIGRSGSGAARSPPASSGKSDSPYRRAN